MTANVKILTTIWITSITTFAFSTACIVPQDSTINAPGELGEVFSVTGLIILVALIVLSTITLLLTRNK